MYSFVQIVDLQQRAVLKGQDSDALRKRAENAEREVRRLRKGVHCVSTCIGHLVLFDSFSRLLTYRGELKRQRGEPEMQRIPLLTS